MDMKRIFCLLATLFLLTGAFALSVLTGRIVDENQHPFPYANVVWLSLPDSAFVTGAVSDEDGRFSLKAAGGPALLRVSSIGYATLYKKVEHPNVGTLQLSPDAQLLV